MDLRNVWWGSRKGGRDARPTAGPSTSLRAGSPALLFIARARTPAYIAIFLRVSSFHSWFRRLHRWIAAVPWLLRRTGRWVAVPDTYSKHLRCQAQERPCLFYRLFLWRSDSRLFGNKLRLYWDRRR